MTHHIPPLSHMPLYVYPFSLYQVPIVDRRAHRLVSAGTLARTHKKNLPPRGVDHPPGGALCLRGHTPTILSPSRIRVKPQRSVRGPRGSKDIKDGAFSKPGILGGLSVSPWVVQEEAERAQRAKSHRQALSKVRAWWTAWRQVAYTVSVVLPHGDMGSGLQQIDAQYSVHATVCVAMAAGVSPSLGLWRGDRYHSSWPGLQYVVRCGAESAKKFLHTATKFAAPSVE